MLAYAFKGIGKFAVVMLPWQLHRRRPTGLFTDENIYAIIILGAHLALRHQRRHGQRRDHRGDAVHHPHAHLDHHRPHRHVQSLAGDDPSTSVPAGWANPFFGWKLGLDWTGILDKVNDAIRQDGNELFGSSSA